jgi:hypothetical protein
MKAWRLDRLGGTLRLEDAPIPEHRPGSVIVKIEASALMSYLKSYVEGGSPSTVRRTAHSHPAAMRSESCMGSPVKFIT